MAMLAHMAMLATTMVAPHRIVLRHPQRGHQIRSLHSQFETSTPPSVRRASCVDRAFTATYEHVDDRRWRRTGFVFARLARGAETANPGAPILRRRSGSRRQSGVVVDDVEDLHPGCLLSTQMVSPSATVITQTVRAGAGPATSAVSG
jgi:hypothetical protein